jgi:nucleotide-binding universal stress UspA family protein
MLRLLLPVDGSPGSDRAVELVIKLYREITPLQIQLLHVLMPVDGIGTGSTRLQADTVEDSGDGTRALSSACALLERQQIPYASEVRRGFVPSTIVQYARTAGCKGIVMGTRGMGTPDGLLGSIARQVIHLADVPVTLVT